ncbi:anthocyanin 3'-O-beta-glucosyltransferase-like [Lolium rigidum]|uniref:anthocyanin 3'-O-beta-glucosyltransferase-like n=1 Tax=Lolium rigidum TaxID=89674 RepID=UPI001F5E3584|nr:anthocyanin 3'-O-beta-glucosyltransferase-like [Lolium rigidum]
MEIFLPAVLGELATRSVSFLINKYSKLPVQAMEINLERILLRAQAIIEEAEGRHITNQGMLRQLRMLRDAMYQGFYVLDTLRYRAFQEDGAGDNKVRNYSWALSKFSSAKRLCLSSSSTKASQELVAENVLDNLRTMILDASGVVSAITVVYVSFGTLTSFSHAEHREIARGLDLAGKNFVWVLGGSEDDRSEWMPDGFAELTGNNDRGFLIRGWAPQTLILSQPALGGFVTHCGWNSVLEAVSAGVPMVTWPRYADQFYNEKLVVEVLKVGVSVGAKDYASCMETHEVISGEVIAGSITRLMGESLESDSIRNKAEELCVKARTAVEKGGGSYNDVGRLMDELMAGRSAVKVGEEINGF